MRKQMALAMLVSSFLVNTAQAEVSGESEYYSVPLTNGTTVITRSGLRGRVQGSFVNGDLSVKVEECSSSVVNIHGSCKERVVRLARTDVAYDKVGFSRSVENPTDEHRCTASGACLGDSVVHEGRRTEVVAIFPATASSDEKIAVFGEDDCFYPLIGRFFGAQPLSCYVRIILVDVDSLAFESKTPKRGSAGVCATCMQKSRMGSDVERLRAQVHQVADRF